MSSLLGIGTSALSAFRRSLDTIGQNISNVNTEGYNRQRVVLSSRDPQFTGAGFIGNGVQISSIERFYNQFLDDQVRTAGSASARFSTLASFGGRIDNLLADPSGGLTPALSAFYDAVQDFSADPASNSSREALFAESASLVDRFQSLDARLADVGAEASAAVAQTVTEINGLAESIADLNSRIVAAGRDAPPNDLLDQRDTLIRELAERVDVTVVPEDSGSISLFIGNGQTLVIGNETFALGVQPSEFDPTRSGVVYRGLTGDTPIENVLTGGTLGALLEFQSGTLDSTRRALGAAAVALTQAVNTQNGNGFDADGQFGGDIFSVGPAFASASSLNSGNADIAVSIEDIGAVDNTGYRLLNDGGTMRLFRTDNDQEVSLTGAGTSADPLRGAGMALVVSGTMNVGDRFEIEPTLGAVAGLARVAADNRAFAAAAPVRATASVANLSDATIDNGTVVDVDNPALLSTSVISFTTPTTYSVNGVGSFSFTQGSPISINGAEFQIAGQPTAGDEFTIERNTGASGDNRNALALAATQSEGVLGGGSLSVGQSYSQLVASVGSMTRQANASADAQSVVLQGAENRRLAASGVDLDQEAAELVRFQQSYQAAAQVISVASTLFDTLINATRR
ncbi:MAG: flagellar hook-associated protein FlgK [Pseudomonadota bacterium]